jgi:hypothetical protein
LYILFISSAFLIFGGVCFLWQVSPALSGTRGLAFAVGDQRADVLRAAVALALIIEPGG